jgi:hypothetical protein
LVFVNLRQIYPVKVRYLAKIKISPGKGSSDFHDAVSVVRRPISLINVPTLAAERVPSQQQQQQQ